MDHSFERKYSRSNTCFVKKAMPPEVQKRLDNVVGLMKMNTSYTMFRGCIGARREKQKDEEVYKHLDNTLTQLQLGELSSKNKKEKNKVRAPVVTIDPPLIPTTTY